MVVPEFPRDYHATVQRWLDEHPLEGDRMTMSDIPHNPADPICELHHLDDSTPEEGKSPAICWKCRPSERVEVGGPYLRKRLDREKIKGITVDIPATDHDGVLPHPPRPVVDPIPEYQMSTPAEYVAETESGHAKVGGSHTGRAWSGCEIEDACPCPQEPCGLVDVDRASLECEHHAPGRGKTLRQMHTGANCPGKRLGTGEQIERDFQPDPVHNQMPSSHDRVIARIMERRDWGIAKYGTELQAFNGRDSIQDALEEVLDLAVYLQTAKDEETLKLQRAWEGGYADAMNDLDVSSAKGSTTVTENPYGNGLPPVPKGQPHFIARFDGPGKYTVDHDLDSSYLDADFYNADGKLIFFGGRVWPALNEESRSFRKDRCNVEIVAHTHPADEVLYPITVRLKALR